MKKFFIVLITLISSIGFSQVIDDLALYNVRELHGATRYIGLGGAFTALGSDFSSVHLNPAGASVYRFSNLGMTFGLQTTYTDAVLNLKDQKLRTSDFNLLIENIGLVMKFDMGSSDWSQLRFGVTYNKLADFYNQSLFTGINEISKNSTLGQYWFDKAKGLTGDQLKQQDFVEELAALQAGILLIDTSSGIVLDYAYYVPGNTHVSYRREENGNLNELAFTFGGKYRDNFYYGMSLGFPILNYTMSDQLTEFGLWDSAAPYDVSSYTLNRYVEMYAKGFNIKLGIIYKLSQWLRTGFAYESPSWYTIDQIYEVDVTSEINKDESGFRSPVITTGNYSYRYKSPSIYRLGMAFVLDKTALISFDYEYSDLTQSKTYVSTNSFNVIEGDIEKGGDVYTGVVQEISTVRVGGEYRIHLISLRAGYNYRQSQYKDEPAYATAIKTWSTGLGFRTKQFIIDLAFSQSKYGQTYRVHPFLDNNDRINATSDFVKNKFTLGIIYRFRI